MKEETPEDGLGKGEARRGRHPDEKSFRDEHEIVAINSCHKLSLVSGHLSLVVSMRSEKLKMTNGQFFSVAILLHRSSSTHNTGRVIAPSAADETRAAYLAKTPVV